MPLPAKSTSQLPQTHVIGFSGHRQLADPTAVSQAIVAVLQEIRKEVPGGWIALSSAAAGADLLFVHAALDQGWTWQASLPLPIAEFERDFSADEWPAVKALLTRATHTHIVMESGTREDAYLSGGIDVVNRCQVLLVVWDGLPARGKGGTADVVAYARSLGRPILIINPDTRTVLRERFQGAN